jgi:hypothetical protein
MTGMERDPLRPLLAGTARSPSSPTGTVGQPGVAPKDSCEAKSRTHTGGNGVVAWDVAATNQDGELVASYDFLTVAKRG